MTVRSEQPRVLVTGSDLDEASLEPMGSNGLDVEAETDVLDRGGIYKRLEGVSYYLYGGIEAADQLGGEEFEQLHSKGLKLIAFAGKGVTDFLNVPAAQEAGIVVTNTPGAVEPSVAEFTTFLSLALLRDGFQRSLAWMSAADYITGDTVSKGGAALGADLSDTKVGIIGLGDIGYLVAKLLTGGYGSRVAYFSRNRKEPAEAELGIEYMPLDRLVRESDLLTIHLANNAETRELMASVPFETASSELYLVNTASEALIDAKRLADLLQEGSIRAAAFDKIYPLDVLRSSGLSVLVPSRLIVTAHAANATQSAWRRMTAMAVDNILSHARGAPPPNVVKLS
jgi:lactate dehydrogenase-like 2-hydroxyacid dehydrogenase